MEEFTLEELFGRGGDGVLVGAAQTRDGDVFGGTDGGEEGGELQVEGVGLREPGGHVQAMGIGG